MRNRKADAAMTATCREACCSVTPRLTVAELFERGFRRNREAPRAIEGAPCTGAEDNTAAFSLDVADGTDRRRRLPRLLLRDADRLLRIHRRDRAGLPIGNRTRN